MISLSPLRLIALCVTAAAFGACVALFFFLDGVTVIGPLVALAMFLVNVGALRVPRRVV